MRRETSASMTLGEASVAGQLPDDPAEGAAEMPRPDIRAQEDRVVDLYARAKLLEAEAATLKAEGKGLAEHLYRAHGLAQIVGAEGVVSVVEAKGSARLDTKRARRFLTPEQIAECTVVGEPSLSFRYLSREVQR